MADLCDDCHRLLGLNPSEGSAKNRSDPIEAEWLICDEVSMLDLALAHALWRATVSTTRVLWIGDEHQLPSVGPGSVLKDVIASDRFPVFRLTHNFRHVGHYRRRAQFAGPTRTQSQ